MFSNILQASENLPHSKYFEYLEHFDRLQGLHPLQKLDPAVYVPMLDPAVYITMLDGLHPLRGLDPLRPMPFSGISREPFVIKIYCFLPPCGPLVVPSGLAWSSVIVCSFGYTRKIYDKYL